MIVEEYAKKQGFRAVERLGTWRGLEVYEELLDEDFLSIGYPQFILADDEKIRMATFEEGLEIMDCFTKDAE